MANQRLKSVLLKCGHRILVPSYQTADTKEYQETNCSKCSIDVSNSNKPKK